MALRPGVWRVWSVLFLPCLVSGNRKGRQRGGIVMRDRCRGREGGI